jgi:predicted dehydrogenase
MAYQPSSDTLFLGFMAPLVPAAAAPGSGGAADPRAINYSCHTRNFEDFITALRAGRAPALDGLEGRKAVAIVQACYESARTGQAVPVDEARR